MTNTSLATVAAKALPALSGESLTYNAAKNVFLSQGYTSAAGNMYYKAIRLSNHLIVYYDIGQGYFHSLLEWHITLCLQRNKRYADSKETMGRIWLQNLQRAERQRREHTNAERVSLWTSKADEPEHR